MKKLKKLTLEDLSKKNGTRHTSGAIHFSDGSMVTFQNVSVSQILSYIRTCGKEFSYFATF